jgi:hypothetical protein
MNAHQSIQRNRVAVGRRRQSHRSSSQASRRSRTASIGILAGAAGTAAMDTLLYLRYRRSGGTQGPLEWEFSAGVQGWEDVSAPGLVGKRLLNSVLGRQAPDKWARSTQNVMHWATGMGWSGPYGVISGARGRAPWTGGLVFGPIVWLAGYVVLPVAKIYQPIWDYDAKTLAKDLSAHLVYGVTAGTVCAALAHSPGLPRAGTHRPG